MSVAPRRRPGRPPLDEHDRLSVSLTVKLPSKQFDAIDAIARRHGLSLPEVTRRALRRWLRTADGA